MRKNEFTTRCLIGILLVAAFAFTCSTDKNNLVTHFKDRSATETQSTPSDEKPEFVEYDTAPKPVGGFGSISQHLVYPDEARKEGMEGRVVVWLKIDAKGRIMNTQIKESVSEQLDRAAIAALKNTEWTPAKKDQKGIDSWIAVPIEFRLQ
jgi:TonB family protein